jgi:NAD+ kinase
MSKPKAAIIADRSKDKVQKALDGMLPLIEAHADIAGVFDITDTVKKLSADFVFVFGGDGTLLHAGRALEARGIPLVGVNIGKLGFLTEFTVEELKDDIREILAGKCPVEERMMLRGVIERVGGGAEERFAALNDFVVFHGAGVRMIELRLAVDGEYVTTYRGDGLVISTPAGSTAHSLSAGGPVLSPRMRAFVVTPICPHTLSARPLVIPADAEIVLTLLHDGAGLSSCAIDGQDVVRMFEGDKLIARRGRRTWKIVKRKEKSFFQTLRNKLNWGGQANYGQGKG